MTDAIRAALEPGPVHHDGATAAADTVSVAAPTVVMATAESAVPRFAQLTYASFHRQGGSGGWQVKDVRGDLDPAEQHAVTARIGTRLAPATRLPTLPTAEERSGLPRRLVHGATAGGAHAFWHTIPAGTDSSGRPGNVFAHVVVDRRPSEPEPPLRPSDLLGAPQWCTPYGAAEVLATSLDEIADPPWGGVPHTRESVVPFLVDAAMSRPGVLAALLDAVADALGEGPPVAIGVADPERAERWIAGVLHLMSPGTSRGVFFSSSEAADALTAASSLHLAVVTPAVLAELDPAELVLLPDDADAVDLGDLEGGQPHRTRPGSEVPVAPWSVLALEVLQDEELALRTLAAADAVAAAVGDRGLPPGWPLAMAVTLAPADLPDAQSEARQVLAACTPDGLRRVPELERAHRRALLGPLGPTTADAWAAAHGDVAGVDPRVAASVYLERALADDAWLAQAGGAPAPADRPASDDDWSGRVAEALVRAEAGSGAVPRLLRVLDLVARAGLVDLSCEGPLGGVLGPMVDDLVVSLLVDPTEGPQLVDEVGPVSEALTRAVLVPGLERRLATAPEPPGRRVPPVVLGWLHPRPPLPPLKTLGTGTTSPVLVEIAVQATAVLPDPAAFRAVALEEAVRRLAENGDDSAVVHLARGRPFSAPQLRPLARARGVRPLAAVLPAMLRTAADTDELVELVDQVRDSVVSGEPGATGEARRLAELRFHATRGVAALDAGSVHAVLQEALQTVEDLFARTRATPPGPVARLVTVALLVDLAGGTTRGTGGADRRETVAWLQRERPPRERVSQLHGDLARVLGDRVVGEVDLAVGALGAAVAVADPARPSPSVLWHTVVGSGRGTPVDDLIAERLSERDPDAVEDFLQAVQQTVAGTAGGPRRVPPDLDRTARALWDLPGPPRPRFARMGRT